MPEMTLSEAAKWAGKGRPAILKAIQTGRISAKKTDTGEWRIDPAELARVYEPTIQGNSNENSQRSTLELADTIAGKDRELALMREMLNAAREETIEARRERDSWKDEANRWQVQVEVQTRLLTHQKAEFIPSAESIQTKVKSSRRSLIAKLMGRN